MIHSKPKKFSRELVLMNSPKIIRDRDNSNFKGASVPLIFYK